MVKNIIVYDSKAGEILANATLSGKATYTAPEGYDFIEVEADEINQYLENRDAYKVSIKAKKLIAK